MKWGARDTLAYNAFTDAGERMRRMLEQARAGKAYKEGSTVTEEQVDNPYVGLMDTNAVADLSPEDRQSMAEYSANPANAKRAAYKMGGEAYDTSPTRMERHRSGLMAQADHYFATGRPEEGGRILERASSLDTADLQRKDLGLSIDAKKRAAENERIAMEAGAELRRARKDPFSYLQKYYNDDQGWAGQGEHAGRRVQFEKLQDGNAMIWFEDKNGNRVPDSTKIFTPKEANKLITDKYFDTLSSIDPKWALENASRMDRQAHQTRLEDLEQKKIEMLDRARKETNDITRKHYEDQAKRYEAEAAKWNQMYGTRSSIDAFNLKQMQAFAKERDELIRRGKLDPKDKDYLSRDQVNDGLNWAQLKYGGTHLPASKAQTPMSVADYAKVEEMALARLSGTKEFKALKTDADRSAALDREVQRLLKNMGGNANVKGLQGDRSGSTPAPSGGAAGVAGLAAQVRSQNEQPASTPASAASPDSTDSVTTYGILTPDALLNRDVERGIPAAVEYANRRKREQEEAAAEMERYRLGGYGGLMQ